MIKRSHYILFGVIALFFIVGGLPITPRFFNKLRHAFYVDLLLLLIFCCYGSFRAKISKFLVSPKTFLGEREKNKWFKILSIFYFLVFVKVSLLNYLSFNVHAMDFSTYDWLIPSLYHTGSFYSPGCDCNHMGYHQTFILFLTAPLHILINHPIFSILLHPIIAWMAYFPLKKLVKHFKLPNIYQVLIIFLYFNFFGVAHIVKNNMHIEVYYLPVILWLLYFISTNHFKGALLAALGMFIIKEDGALYVSSTFFAAYLFKNRNPRYIVVSIMGLVFFLINTKYIIPPFRGLEEYEFVNAVSKYGKSIGETLQGMISDPLEVGKDIATGGWVKYVGYFYFLPLINGFFVVAAFPIIFIHSIAISPLMRGMVLYYSAPLLPFLFYYFIEFLSKKKLTFLKSTFLLTDKIKGVLLVLLILTSTLIGSGYFTFRAPRFNYSEFRANVAKIPKDKLICAMDSIFPHIGYERRLLRMSEICKIKEVDVFIINHETWLNDMTQDYLNNFVRRIETSKLFMKNKTSDGFIYYIKK